MIWLGEHPKDARLVVEMLAPFAVAAHEAATAIEDAELRAVEEGSARQAAEGEVVRLEGVVGDLVLVVF